MSKSEFSYQRSTLALAALLALPGGAFAQSAEPPATEGAEAQTLERVVVKSRGRTEVLQNVPASVKAFSAQAISDAGIARPADFIGLTPNVSLTETQSAGTSFITIRGLTQVRNGDSPVAVVVDGVPQTSAQQFNQELFDIRSIEVLRGPQGALYGRNASGGAILIETKAPSNQAEGYVRAGVGNGGYAQTQLALSGPVIEDRLYYRAVASHTRLDGYFTNIYLHDKVDRYRDSSFHGTLRWDATDDLRIDLRASYVDNRAGALNFVYQPTHVKADCTADESNLFDESRMDPNRVVRTFCANNPGLNTRSLRNATLRAEYNLGFATLTGTFAKDSTQEYIQGDGYPYTASRSLDFFGAPSEGTQTQFVDTQSNSYELRLTSKSKPGLRWMAGVYGLTTDHFISSGNGDDLGKGIAELRREPAFGNANNPTVFWMADDNRNIATAAFGNVDWDVSKQLEASFALRYDRDRRKDVVDFRNSAGLPNGCTQSNASACTKTATFSATQPKISLRYKFDDGSVVYGSWGEGFRSGLFNQSGISAIAATALPPVHGVTDLVGAEKTTSAEIGIKQEFFNGRLRFNAALFASDVQNSPYFVYVPSVGAQVMVGIDKVSLSGGEVELLAQLAPGLDGGLGLGLTQSKIRRYDVDPSAIGHWAPYVPKLGGNASLQYKFPVTSGLRVLIRGDLIYKGKQFWDTENSAARDALTLMNLRLGLEDAKGKWQTSVAISNTTNKVYNAEWVSGGFAQPAQPRTVRVDLRYNY